MKKKSFIGVKDDLKLKLITMHLEVHELLRDVQKTVDDILSDFSGANMFSKLDAKSGFCHIKLD